MTRETTDEPKAARRQKVARGKCEARRHWLALQKSVKPCKGGRPLLASLQDAVELCYLISGCALLASGLPSSAPAELLVMFLRNMSN
jgi:hypothetical protein